MADTESGHLTPPTPKATYLFLWNSERWNRERLAAMSDVVKAARAGELRPKAPQKQRRVKTRWSCGNSKRLQKGDRAFFIRLDQYPQGIVASGTITRGSSVDVHWDATKRQAGKTSRFVWVKFDALLCLDTDPILPRGLLSAPPFSTMNWDTRVSGVRIPDNIAEELERVWTDVVNGKGFSLPEEVEEAEVIYEGAVRRISVNAYERNHEARRQCIAHYGPTCCICGFDFADAYGEVGKAVIHVHHLRQLSEIGGEYQMDPIRDLRPVCPNCHAIIHRRKPAYTLEEVEAFLHQAKRQSASSGPDLDS